MTEAFVRAPRVAVLMGGPSSEHEISLSSGKQVLSALVASDPLPVVIAKDASWEIAGQRHSPGRALEILKDRVDVIFVALHGPFGEDGTVQGLLESVGLPFTGSGVLGSALAMDKVRTKLVYRACGLPTAEFVAVERRRFAAERAGLLQEITQVLGYPVALKPSRAGSSVGVSFPKSQEELEAALSKLFTSEELCLVERYVRGREFTCGILEIAEEGRQLALPITEIIPGEGYEFFDYEAKYTPGATREVTPAEIAPELSKELQALALEAHRWLDCRDFSRTDFMVDSASGIYILETNTIPGLTPTSLLPQAAAAEGIGFEKLVRILIDNAARRRAPPVPG